MDCGCVIASDVIEHHLKSNARRVAMYSCPKCAKFIVSTMRYMNLVKVKYEQIVHINKKVHSLDSKLIETRDDIKQTLRRFLHEHKDKGKVDCEF